MTARQFRVYRQVGYFYDGTRNTLHYGGWRIWCIRCNWGDWTVGGQSGGCDMARRHVCDPRAVAIQAATLAGIGVKA